MKQQLHFITLGVRDLAAMRKWYSVTFGWTPLIDQDGVVFFNMNGVVLALYPQVELAKDVGGAAVPAESGSRGATFTLSVNFAFEREVDAAVAALREKGVEVLREPEKVFWGGYRGYIADPEGNCWELAYNPFLVMDDTGRVVAHR